MSMVEEEKGISSLFDIQNIPSQYVVTFVCQAAKRILPLLEKEGGGFGEAAAKVTELVGQLGQGKTATGGLGSIFQTIVSTVKRFSGAEASTYESTSESAQHVMDYLGELTSKASPETQNSIFGVLREIYESVMKGHEAAHEA